MQLFDLNSIEINCRLSETIAWCTRANTGMLPQSDAIRRHLQRLSEAGELMKEAYGERNHLWKRLLMRNYQKSRKYRRGAKLLQETDPRSSFSLIAQFRSELLNPVRTLSEAQGVRERESVVNSVVQRRSDLLQSNEASIIYQVPGLVGGRLLLYWPEENLFDGAAEYSTRGFFDVDNTPPWDTWVYFSNGTLLSWVPPLLLDVVQCGIDANPEACIQWLVG